MLVSDVVLNGNEVLVDVMYNKISCNPFLIYFVQKSEMVQLTPSPHIWIWEMQGIPVKIRIPGQKRGDAVIPIRIMPTITSGVTTVIGTNDVFRYFGQYVRNPLTHYQSNIRYPGVKYLLSASQGEEEAMPTATPLDNDIMKSLTEKYAPLTATIGDSWTRDEYYLLSDLEKMLEVARGVLISPDNLPPPWFIYHACEQFELLKEDISLFRRYMMMEWTNYTAWQRELQIGNISRIQR
jgi:hypothetical protein